MQPDIEKRLSELEQKVDAIYISVEKTRKYFFWTLITTLVVLILPLIGLLFALPSFLGNYSQMIETLGV